MARLPRYAIPGQPQHVIQRGNNREPVFADEENSQYYVDRLHEAVQKN